MVIPCALLNKCIPTDSSQNQSVVYSRLAMKRMQSLRLTASCIAYMRISPVLSPTTLLFLHSPEFLQICPSAPHRGPSYFSELRSQQSNTLWRITAPSLPVSVRESSGTVPRHQALIIYFLIPSPSPSSGDYFAITMKAQIYMEPTLVHDIMAALSVDCRA